MRSIIVGFGLVAWLMLPLMTGCDQRQNPSDQPDKQSGSTGTSSNRGETHPDQPTGQPQSADVPSPGGSHSGR
jgi:hypothetical protein